MRHTQPSADQIFYLQVWGYDDTLLSTVSRGPGGYTIYGGHPDDGERRVILGLDTPEEALIYQAYRAAFEWWTKLREYETRAKTAQSLMKEITDRLGSLDKMAASGFDLDFTKLTEGQLNDLNRIYRAVDQAYEHGDNLVDPV